MFMDITGIDLFDQSVGVTFANVGLTCSWISIDLFDQKYGHGMITVRLRCSLLSLALIYLIKLGIWHVLKLDLGVLGNYW